MKKLLLITVLLFSFQFGKSQTYIPMVEDSMLIVNQVQAIGTVQNYYYRYLGDTIIGGKNYFKCYSNYYSLDTNYAVLPSMIYHGAIRENTKKVYFVFKDSLTEKKIYDFDMSIGDTTSLYRTKYNETKKAILYKIDTNYLLPRKQYYYRFLQTTYDSIKVVIEGFGNSFDYMHFAISTDIELLSTSYRMCVFKKNNSSHNYPATFRLCMNTGSLIEKQLTKNIKLYPNPSKEKIILENTDNNLSRHSGKRIRNLKIFSINGKLIKEVNFTNQKNKETVSVKELPKGIYFMQVLVEDNLVNLKFVKE